METPDFYSVISEEADKTIGFHDGLLELFDHMLNDAGITDQDKLSQLAKTRSRIDIELKTI